MAELAMDIEAVEIENDLIPCHICGRTFLVGPLKKHINICEKNAVKKRKVFNSLKQRIEGTELESFHQPSYLRKPEVVSNSDTKITERNKKNWKEKHKELVEAIRAAKSSGSTDLMSPQRSTSASGSMGHTSRCPSCERQFGPRAFDRHVEWCKEHQRTRLTSPANIAAKERLEMRTKYKAPLTKSKRALNKEKYSGRISQSSSVSLKSTESKVTTEPIIKHKNQDKLLKSHNKLVPKINSTEINHSISGMTVSQMNMCLTNTTNNNHSNTKTNVSSNTNSSQSKASTNSQKKKRKIPRYVKHKSRSELSFTGKTYEKVTLDLTDNTDDKTIEIIKAPPANYNSYDLDSLTDRDSVSNCSKNDLNYATDNIELSDPIDDDIPKTNIKQVWDIAEKEFLNSLKSKSDTNSEVFNYDIKTKFTSTPMEKNYQYQDLNTGSLIYRSEDNLLYETSSITNLTNTDTRLDNVTDISPRNNEFVVEPTDNEFIDELNELALETDDDIAKKLKIISESYDLINDSLESPKSIGVNISESNMHTSTIQCCSVKDLEQFLNKISSKCQVQLEVIASDADTLKTKVSPELKLFRENSHEMVIQGANSHKFINELLTANEIKSVNVIFINDDIPLYETSKSHISDVAENLTETKKFNSQVSVKVPTIKKRTLNRITKKKKKFVPRDHIKDKEKLLKLPFIQNFYKGEKPKIDKFWEKISHNKKDPNSLLIQKSFLYESHLKYNQKLNNNNNNNLEMVKKVEEIRGDVPKVEIGLCLPPIIKDKEKQNSTISSSSSTVKSKEEYNPFVAAEKQLQELLNCDDFQPYTTNPPSNPNTSQTNNSIKRSSVIDPPNDFQDKINFLQDNFEFIENFINDNYVNDKNNKKQHNTSCNDNSTKESLNLNSILTHRKYSDDNTSIDPRLINEVDNLQIPDKIFAENPSPISVDHYSEQYDKSISLLEIDNYQKPTVKRLNTIQQNDQTLDDINFDEFISSFDDDDSFPTLKSFLQTSHSLKSDKNESKNVEKDKIYNKTIQKSTLSLHCSVGKNSNNSKVENKTVSPLKRSVSLSNPITKARSMKCKQDINDYLHVKSPSSVQKPLKCPSNLFPENHELYDEYKQFEEEYKRDKDKMQSGDESSNDEGRLHRSRDTFKDRKIDKPKLSGDSAYGSLNRKSPKIQSKLPNRLPVQRGVSLERSSSSSGSETIPTTTTTTPLKKSQTTAQKLSKFCHECGSKYPLDTAKFCVECGIKRLVL